LNFLCKIDNMGLLNTCWLLLPIFFYLGSLADGGKCTGRWAIHACGGGNGKRSDINYPSLPDEDGAARADTEDGDSRQRDLLTRLTRLSGRNADSTLDARLVRGEGQDAAEENELAPRRWSGEDEQLMVDVGREEAALQREGGAAARAEERARLQAALRLIKRLLVKKSSAEVTNNQDSMD
jgi:hypothetical protein